MDNILKTDIKSYVKSYIDKQKILYNNNNNLKINKHKHSLHIITNNIEYNNNVVKPCIKRNIHK